MLPLYPLAQRRIAMEMTCSGLDDSIPMTSRLRAGEEHDPVKTRIIHVMVLGTFALSAYNILPYMGTPPPPLPPLSVRPA